MHIKRKQGWEIPESQATDKNIYLNRRQLLKGLGAGALLSGTFGGLAQAQEPPKSELHKLTEGFYPANKNALYEVAERPLTEREYAVFYNNFYEFGSHKYIWKTAQKLETHPWEVVIDGEVEKPLRMDFTDLLKRMPLEQRVYRHRCVEAWAMTVPWEGFALKELLALAKPTGKAKYLAMETLADKKTMPGMRQFWYPWPYTEGLTLAEAGHDLSFIATGLYGEPMPKQNGAPLRLVVPWKYGFKSVKSIRRFTFTSTRPLSFWEELQPKEYGFWANVNPDVPHLRWSQAKEKLLGEDRKVPTQLYNGYGEFVASLYAGEDTSSRKLFF